MIGVWLVISVAVNDCLDLGFLAPFLGASILKALEPLLVNLPELSILGDPSGNSDFFLAKPAPKIVAAYILEY